MPQGQWVELKLQAQVEVELAGRGPLLQAVQLRSPFLLAVG